ncbi:MAG: hypothetical protein ACXAEU_08370 [Candidatus Hodarchaeales archaeon]
MNIFTDTSGVLDSVTTPITESSRQRVTFQFQQARGDDGILVIKALYPTTASGSRKLFHVFVAAVVIELNNVTDAKLLLNLASEERVTLVRWVDIYRYDDINPKSSKFNKDRTIPGLGIAAILKEPVELSPVKLSTRRSMSYPFKKVITSKISKIDKLALKKGKERFLYARKRLIELVKSTGSIATPLKSEKILSLFQNICDIGYEDKSFFKDQSILRQYLALDNIPHVPHADFPFQKDLPVDLPLGPSPVNPVHEVGFPRLIDQRLLIAGGDMTTRMTQALKIAASTGQRVIVLDLSRNNGQIPANSWQEVLATCSTSREPGNDCNVNVYNLTAPDHLNIASMTAYKSSRMASYMIHSSQMDEYYRIGDHARSLLSTAYGSAGSNTVTANKLLELLESGVGALRPNSTQEEMVTVLVDSYKDYPEINSPVPVTIGTFLGTISGHSWIRFSYQGLPVRKLVALWAMHEIIANGFAGFSIIINGVENLAPATIKANKYQIINEEIRSLINEMATSNTVIMCSERVANLHDSIFLPVQNAVYLKIADLDWQAIRKKHGFKIESERFETLKKLERQAFLVREDRSSTPFVFNLLPENKILSDIKNRLLKTTEINKGHVSIRDGLTRDVTRDHRGNKSLSSRSDQSIPERYFNRTGVEDPSLLLPYIIPTARAFLEVCQFLDSQKSVEEQQIKLLLAKIVDPSFTPTSDRSVYWDRNDRKKDDSLKEKKRDYSPLPERLEEPVKLLSSKLTKSNFFSTQFIEKRRKRMNWSIKQQGSTSDQ